MKILPLFCAIFLIESTIHKYTTNPCSTQEHPIPERCVVQPFQNTCSTKPVKPLRCNCCHVRSLTKSIPVLSSTKQTYLPPSSLCWPARLSSIHTIQMTSGCVSMVSIGRIDPVILSLILPQCLDGCLGGNQFGSNTTFC